MALYEPAQRYPHMIYTSFIRHEKENYRMDPSCETSAKAAKCESLVKRTIYSTPGQHRYLSEEMVDIFSQISSYGRLMTNNQIVIHTEESLTRTKEARFVFLNNTGFLHFPPSLSHGHFQTLGIVFTWVGGR